VFHLDKSCAPCIAGREALLQDPSGVAEALQHVVTDGWTDEARLFAEAALLAMSDRQPDTAAAAAGHAEKQGQAGGGAHQKHVMLSYQWSCQSTVRRVVNELQVRGYLTWFGAWSTRSLALDDDVRQSLARVPSSSSPQSSSSSDISCLCAVRPGQYEREHCQ